MDIGLKVITSSVPSPRFPTPLLTVSLLSQLLRESASSGSIGNSLQIVARFYCLLLLFMAAVAVVAVDVAAASVPLANLFFLVINQFPRLRLPFRSARKSFAVSK